MRIFSDDGYYSPYSGGHGNTPETRTDPSVWVRPATPHSPNYTQQERPYSYSEFFLYGHRDDIKYSKEDPKGPIHAEYSDRIWQWDREKAESCWARHCEGYRWSNAPITQIEKFLRDYHGKPSLDLVAVAEGCNASNGYPYFVVWFRTPEKK